MDQKSNNVTTKLQPIIGKGYLLSTPLLFEKNIIKRQELAPPYKIRTHKEKFCHHRVCKQNIICYVEFFWIDSILNDVNWPQKLHSKPYSEFFCCWMSVFRKQSCQIVQKMFLFFFIYGCIWSYGMLTAECLILWNIEGLTLFLLK